MKTGLVYFFTFLTFFASFLSCSKAGVQETPVAASATADYSYQLEQINDALETLESHFMESRTTWPSTLDQATLDGYAAMVGLPPGSVTVQMTQDVLNAVSVAQLEGIEDVLDANGYAGYSKDVLAAMSRLETPINFDSDPNFDALSPSEKDILLLADAVLDDMAAQGRSNIGTAIGVIAGISIAGAIGGGAVVIVIGVIIGAIIGGGINKQ